MHFHHLNIGQLVTVSDALTAAREAISAVQNQPRCKGAPDDVLEFHGGLLDATLKAIRDEIEGWTEPTELRDRYYRAEFLVREMAQHGNTGTVEAWDEVVTLVNKLRDDLRKAEGKP